MILLQYLIIISGEKGAKYYWQCFELCYSLVKLFIYFFYNVEYFFALTIDTIDLVSESEITKNFKLVVNR